MNLGIVTGLAAEARLARPLGLALAGGGQPDGAEAAAEWLVEQRVDALVSFGLAGGLDPALRPGDVVVPATVRDDNYVYATDPRVSARFGARGGTLFAGGFFAAPAPSPWIWRAAPWPASPRGTACPSRCCGRSATRRTARCPRRPWWH
jgi:hypothetical protein